MEEKLRNEIERLTAAIKKLRTDHITIILHLEAEIKRLRTQLKTAVWSDSEECRMLTAENEQLRAEHMANIAGLMEYEKRTVELMAEVGQLRAALNPHNPGSDQ